jgi:hypothetical protein
MVLRWSTSKIEFSDPDLAPKWLPSAGIVLTYDPMGKLFKKSITEQTMIYKPCHRKLKIEKHEPH